MALIDFQYVTRALGMPDSAGDPVRARVEEWIAEAGAEIRSIVNQPIERETVTDVFDGNGSTVYRPGYFPMSSLSALYYRTGYGSDAVWTAIASTEFELVGSSIYYAGGFARGVANYKAVYLVGYTSTAIPEDIKAVCRDMVVLKALDARVEGITGLDARLGVLSVARAANGATATTTFKDLGPEIRRKLRRYRKIIGP